MKIAIFLDVDKTITKNYIQEIYASELGMTEAYEKIEYDFQNKLIDFAEFGNRLIPIFAKGGFSKTKAEDLFNKVELRSGAEKLFALKEKGVDIFLVSSGPNYYVNVLGDRVGIPKERVLSSEYIFNDEGIISKCYAKEDEDKVKFVVNNIAVYDITIGIGDNHVHDSFVNVCTIAMFMEKNVNYIHVPHFNAVSTLVESLLRTPTLEKEKQTVDGVVTIDLFKTVTMKTVWSRFSAGLWFAICGMMFTAFTLGASADYLKGFIYPTNHSNTASAPRSSP